MQKSGQRVISGLHELVRAFNDYLDFKRQKDLESIRSFFEQNPIDSPDLLKETWTIHQNCHNDDLQRIILDKIRSLFEQNPIDSPDLLKEAWRIHKWLYTDLALSDLIKTRLYDYFETYMIDYNPHNTSNPDEILQIAFELHDELHDCLFAQKRGRIAEKIWCFVWSNPINAQSFYYYCRICDYRFIRDTNDYEHTGEFAHEYTLAFAEIIGYLRQFPVNNRLKVLLPPFTTGLKYHYSCCVLWKIIQRFHDDGNDIVVPDDININLIFYSIEENLFYNDDDSINRNFEAFKEIVFWLIDQFSNRILSQQFSFLKCYEDIINMFRYSGKTILFRCSDETILLFLFSCLPQECQNDYRYVARTFRSCDYLRWIQLSADHDNLRELKITPWRFQALLFRSLSPDERTYERWLELSDAAKHETCDSVQISVAKIILGFCFFFLIFTLVIGIRTLYQYLVVRSFRNVLLQPAINPVAGLPTVEDRSESQSTRTQNLDLE